MEEMLVQNETLSLTEQNLLAYFETHDVKYVTEDARFKNLSTGDVHTDRAEIGAMLHFIYHVAFDAKAEMHNYFLQKPKLLLKAFQRKAYRRISRHTANQQRSKCSFMPNL